MSPGEDRLRGLPPGGGQIRRQDHEGWTELVIDQPARRNAMSPGMMVGLLDHLRSLTRAPPAAVLIRGEGTEALCSGGDLEFVRQHLLDPSNAAAMACTMGPALDGLLASDALVVVAVEGAALGGGAELLTVGDWVICGDRARVGFVHGRLGVTPGWGGGGRLMQRVGRRRAARLLLVADALGAEDACAVGLVDQVVPSGQAAEAGARMCAQAARVGGAAGAALRAILRGEDEAEAFLSVWGSPRHVAALAGSPAGRTRTP